MPSDFTFVFVDHLLDVDFFVFAFLQYNRANNFFNIVIFQVYLDGETTHEALKIRGVIERTLTCSYDHQATVHLLAQRFSDLLNIQSSLGILTDELLDFVEHEKGAGQLAIYCNHFSDDRTHFINADVFNIGIISPKQWAYL